ncbi:MAG: ketopantoate reductase family protein [Thermoplasmata archaeon]|nr:MAG: ketopantoate reductase family protein [Thermoplasmata archaeon]
MKFIIFGAGAIGSLFGALLSTKNDVLLVGRKEHIEAIEREGLKIEGITKGIFHPKTKWDGSRYDVVILTTKAYDTKKALEEILHKFGKIPVLSLQNGLKNEEMITEIIGEEYAIGGITSHGATFLRAGKILHAGTGETVIGELNGRITERIEEIEEAFNTCGIDTRISTDIKKEIWKKAVVNVVINGLTSLLRCKNGELLKSRHAEETMEKICTECIEIARAEGIGIGEEIIDKTKEVAKNTAENISSMLQDIMKGKKTEVEEINGEIVRIAKKHGINACINEFLFKMIKAMENVRHLG